MSNPVQLVAEWQPQEAIILAWPDQSTDWAPWLKDVHQTYLQLISAISGNATGVILLVKPRQIEAVSERLGALDKVLLVSADYNDTWCRDYAFLTCKSSEGMIPVEFCFNGWGNKFDASKDNLVNRNYLAPLCQHVMLSSQLICEGGAIEIDDEGQLLSTSMCLLNPQRNGVMNLEQYKQAFKQTLGATSCQFFANGHLQGDDTDGHIDTLVRFTPHNGLVIQSCFNRPDDVHFGPLNKLVEECKDLLPDHHIFELPLPHITNQDGERLPASYANYLINNQQILCPVYRQPEDEMALEIIRKAHPQHQIVAIDSLSLVQQYGSIHCISMQVPEGTLTSNVKALFGQGVTLYEHE